MVILKKCSVEPVEMLDEGMAKLTGHISCSREEGKRAESFGVCDQD